MLVTETGDVAVPGKPASVLFTKEQQMKKILLASVMAFGLSGAAFAGTSASVSVVAVSGGGSVSASSHGFNSGAAASGSTATGGIAATSFGGTLAVGGTATEGTAVATGHSTASISGGGKVLAGAGTLSHNSFGGF